MLYKMDETMRMVKHVAIKHGVLIKVTGDSEVEEDVVKKRGVQYVVHAELREWYLHLAAHGYDA